MQNPALASAPCTFPAIGKPPFPEIQLLPRRRALFRATPFQLPSYLFRKSCSRLNAVHISASSQALLGLSRALLGSLGALLGSLGPILGCLGFILGRRWAQTHSTPPKLPPRLPKTGQYGPQKVPRRPLDGPKMAPHSPKMAQDGPKMAQDSPTTGAGQLKTGPGQPKTAQDSQGQPKTVPRQAQDSPRQAQSKFYWALLGAN